MLSRLLMGLGGSPLLLPRPTYNNTADLHEIVLSQTDVLIELSPEITTWDQFLTIYQIEDNATFPFMQNQAVFKLDLRVNAAGALGAATGVLLWLKLRCEAHRRCADFFGCRFAQSGTTMRSSSRTSP